MQKTAVINAHQTFDRAQALLKTAAGTQKDFDAAEAALRQAQGQSATRRRPAGPPQSFEPRRRHRPAGLLPSRRNRAGRPAGGGAAAAGKSQSPLLRAGAGCCPRSNMARRVAVTCDGCDKGLTAKVSFIAGSAEYTPPVIYSLTSAPSSCS